MSNRRGGSSSGEEQPRGMAWREADRRRDSDTSGVGTGTGSGCSESDTLDVTPQPADRPVASGGESSSEKVGTEPVLTTDVAGPSSAKPRVVVSEASGSDEKSPGKKTGAIKKKSVKSGGTSPEKRGVVKKDSAEASSPLGKAGTVRRYHPRSEDSSSEKSGTEAESAVRRSPPKKHMASAGSASGWEVLPEQVAASEVEGGIDLLPEQVEAVIVGTATRGQPPAEQAEPPASAAGGEDQLITPEAVWNYCHMVIERYSQVLEALITKAVNVHTELRSVMGPPDKAKVVARLQRTAVRKRCRQVIDMYRMDLVDDVSKVTTLREAISNALRAVISSAVAVARLEASLKDMSLQDPEGSQQDSGAGVCQSSEASAAGEDQTRAAQSAEEVAGSSARDQQLAQSEDWKEGTGVLSKMLQALLDVEIMLKHHLRVLQLLGWRERKADAEMAAFQFTLMRDQLMRQARHFDFYAMALVARFPDEGLTYTPLRSRYGRATPSPPPTPPTPSPPPLYELCLLEEESTSPPPYSASAPTSVPTSPSQEDAAAAASSSAPTTPRRRGGRSSKPRSKPRRK